MSARRELLIATIARLLQGCQHVAVGALSPIPASGALLARARSAEMRVSLLGSRRHNFFTNGGVELFDCAAEGRIDAFFLGGGQIDGEGNINLVGAGAYPLSRPRWPGCFGSTFLYYVVPRVILFREGHNRRSLVERVDFVSAAGPRQGPYALLTELALFGFDGARRRFVLRSIHPGHGLEEVLDNTGFAFDRPDPVPVTPMPDKDTLDLLQGPVRAEIAETYPRFAASLAG